MTQADVALIGLAVMGRNLVLNMADHGFTVAVSNRGAAAADGAWRRVVATTVQLGIPASALTSALAFYDGYRRQRLPANLTQAQRDYFGAHTYERVDRPRGQFFHTNWTGHGGDVTSRAYQA